MSSIQINEDLRSKKTKNALYTAMFSLLKAQNFRKITIKSICEEALISRAAFYAHFIDKYDLLKHCIARLWPLTFSGDDPYEQTEAAVNGLILKNAAVLENLICDADNETIDILFHHLLSTMNMPPAKEGGRQASPKNVVLSNFYAGGMIFYLLWQIKYRFPSDVPPMNRYLYEIICKFHDWQPIEE